MNNIKLLEKLGFSVGIDIEPPIIIFDFPDDEISTIEVSGNIYNKNILAQEDVQKELRCKGISWRYLDD